MHTSDTSLEFGRGIQWHFWGRMRHKSIYRGFCAYEHFVQVFDQLAIVVDIIFGKSMGFSVNSHAFIVLAPSRPKRLK